MVSAEPFPFDVDPLAFGAPPDGGALPVVRMAPLLLLAQGTLDSL
jgi:hypothetical protein